MEDTDFRDYLAACPDPFEGGDPPAGARAWPEERRRRELADLELDAMYALTKYVRRRGGNAGTRRGRYRELKESELKLRRRARLRGAAPRAHPLEPLVAASPTASAAAPPPKLTRAALARRADD